MVLSCAVSLVTGWFSSLVVEEDRERIGVDVLNDENVGCVDSGSLLIESSF
jgi:hypothetical protein